VPSSVLQVVLIRERYWDGVDRGPALRNQNDPWWGTSFLVQQGRLDCHEDWLEDQSVYAELITPKNVPG
jgi:hypothetical protein